MLNWFKYFDQKISQILSKNASIPSDKNMPQGSKCFNTSGRNMSLRGKQNVSLAP